MLIFFKVDCDVLPKLVSFEKARVANNSLSDLGLQDHGRQIGILGPKTLVIFRTLSKIKAVPSFYFFKNNKRVRNFIGSIKSSF